MQIPLLQDLVIILGLSMAVLLVGMRLCLRAIVGFLVTGVIAGPHGIAVSTLPGGCCPEN
jgi:CPA2 family monovalent cation:H+ antiporter-2